MICLTVSCSHGSFFPLYVICVNPDNSLRVALPQLVMGGVRAGQSWWSGGEVDQVAGGSCPAANNVQPGCSSAPQPVANSLGSATRWAGDLVRHLATGQAAALMAGRAERWRGLLEWAGASAEEAWQRVAPHLAKLSAGNSHLRSPPPFLLQLFVTTPDKVARAEVCLCCSPAVCVRMGIVLLHSVLFTAGKESL
eukprot:726077-Prorocentrum_minimum.AAC.1